MAVAVVLSACATATPEGVHTHAAAPAPAAASRPVDAALLSGLPRLAVQATIHGETHTYEGPALIDVAAAITPFEQPVRGAALGTVVTVTARDGYRVSFGLAELDAATTGRAIILADTVDGSLIGAEDGPYRVIVEGDLRGARQARMVERIEVIQP